MNQRLIRFEGPQRRPRVVEGVHLAHIGHAIAIAIGEHAGEDLAAIDDTAGIAIEGSDLLVGHRHRYIGSRTQRRIDLGGGDQRDHRIASCDQGIEECPFHRQRSGIRHCGTIVGAAIEDTPDEAVVDEDIDRFIGGCQVSGRLEGETHLTSRGRCGDQELLLDQSIEIEQRSRCRCEVGEATKIGNPIQITIFGETSGDLTAVGHPVAITIGAIHLEEVSAASHRRARDGPAPGSRHGETIAKGVVAASRTLRSIIPLAAIVDEGGDATFPGEGSGR